jgi:hypothetical protein
MSDGDDDAFGDRAPHPENETGSSSYKNRHTSQEAAELLDAEKRNNTVFRIIFESGEKGAIGSDIREITGWEMQVISPAYAILYREGSIKAKIDPRTGKELVRRGHLGRNQVIWFANGPDDPIYERPTKYLQKVLRLLPKLTDIEADQVHELTRRRV